MMHLSPETIDSLKSSPDHLELKVTDSLYERGFKEGYNFWIQLSEQEPNQDQ